MTSLVSVVIPARDRAACVGEAVASVLAQADVDLECVLVDDASTDATPAILRDLASDPRVQVIERTTAGGPSAARNTGLAAARGRLVTFHDSDDLMPPGRLARQVELYDTLGVDGVYGRYQVHLVPGVELPRWLAAQRDWDLGWSWTGVMAEREIVTGVGGYDEALRLGEDFDLIVRLREAGRTVTAVDDVFVHKRWFGDNLTYELDASGSSIGTVLRRHMARTRPSR